MKSYDHKKIEKKWQKEWEKKGIYKAKDGKGKKFYSLVEFPYPSGDGLHVGHPRPYIAMDVISRKRRLEGYNVLFPIGWDAFGLPTENYAIKTGIHPKIVTKKNTDNFRKQIQMLGISFDWNREINTTDPEYYKWTQWIFLQFYKKGLAYKAEIPINWCPKDKIGLANEEVIDGKCERCGEQTERRMKEQWMLAITKYADRLDKDLDLVDYPLRVKLSQRNWIGRSEGAEIEFKITNYELRIKVFTTRADTLFGVTYVVLAPEHSLVNELLEKVENKNEVLKYISDVKKKSEMERTAEGKEKTGVELKGIKAINPANNEEVSVWIADYVLAGYGTGAVMAVPAHDERDFEFAKKYNLQIKQVIIPVFGESKTDEKERHAVAVFVRRPSDGKYLFLFAKAFNEISKVYGGIEQNEKAGDTAIREVFEETGYKTKFVRDLGLTTQSHFYHPHKKENRRLLCNLIELELIDEKQYEIAEEEKLLHEILWLSYEEAKQKINDAKELYDFSLFEGKNYLTKDGVLINSEKFDKLDSEDARKKITEFVGGKIVTKYKLRDWVFSRQRYWGEPIPLINCEKCGLVPIPEKDLPLKLPEVKSYKLTDTGESPLAGISKWVNTKCPKCKGPAKRETDTMPNWAGSSWYYLRYCDPKNKKVFADKKKLKYWLDGSPRQTGGVDWYNGGMEHTTLHLLYSRFWHKFLYDLKLVPTSEPYKKRTSHGLIMGEGGVKMSKSLGNVVNPDSIVKTYGADTLRVYEMFMGPFEEPVAWSTESIIGPRRFIEKVWRIGEKVMAKQMKNFGKYALGELKRGFSQNSSSASLQNSSVLKLLHKTIKKVSEDIEAMRFNTAVSALMILATEMEKSDYIEKEDFKKFLQILAPFAPHVTEELWQQLQQARPVFLTGLACKSINFSKWPKWDERLIKDEEVKIAVQVNGKVRAEMMIQANEKEDEIKERAVQNETVKKFLPSLDIKKIIYVKNRLINIVV
ncbi:MAG: class I tRNA ligase family protein [Candidatus Paceibacterota bacterium]|jgi:leucyl-tRNA synthetase